MLCRPRRPFAARRFSLPVLVAICFVPLLTKLTALHRCVGDRCVTFSPRTGPLRPLCRPSARGLVSRRAGDHGGMWTTDRVIAAPPEAVWALLVDLDAWPRWGPTIARATLSDRGSSGAGVERHGVDGLRRRAAVHRHRVRTRSLLGVEGRWCAGYTPRGSPGTERLNGEFRCAVMGAGLSCGLRRRVAAHRPNARRAALIRAGTRPCPTSRFGRSVAQCADRGAVVAKSGRRGRCGRSLPAPISAVLQFGPD